MVRRGFGIHCPEALRFIFLIKISGSKGARVIGYIADLDESEDKVKSAALLVSLDSPVDNIYMLKLLHQWMEFPHFSLFDIYV
jgi:hypothetical protein